MRVVIVVTCENQVNSYCDQLKLGQVCEFEVEFDNTLKPKFEIVEDSIDDPYSGRFALLKIITYMGCM